MLLFLFAVFAVPPPTLTEITQSLTISQWAKLLGIVSTTATTLLGGAAYIAWRWKIKPKIATTFVSKLDCEQKREELQRHDTSLYGELELITRELEKYNQRAEKQQDSINDVAIAVHELAGQFIGFKELLDVQLEHVSSHLDHINKKLDKK